MWFMPPAYVKPYVKRQKNDMADASMIENIDYSNFKDKVAEAQGDFRAGVYGEVWNSL